MMLIYSKLCKMMGSKSCLKVHPFIQTSVTMVIHRIRSRSIVRLVWNFMIWNHRSTWNQQLVIMTTQSIKSHSSKTNHLSTTNILMLMIKASLKMQYIETISSRSKNMHRKASWAKNRFNSFKLNNIIITPRLNALSFSLLIMTN